MAWVSGLDLQESIDAIAERDQRLAEIKSELLACQIQSIHQRRLAHVKAALAICDRALGDAI